MVQFQVVTIYPSDDDYLTEGKVFYPYKYFTNYSKNRLTKGDATLHLLTLFSGINRCFGIYFASFF
jgi:hypothetical protein